MGSFVDALSGARDMSRTPKRANEASGYGTRVAHRVGSGLLQMPESVSAPRATSNAGEVVGDHFGQFVNLARMLCVFDPGHLFLDRKQVATADRWERRHRT